MPRFHQGLLFCMAQKLLCQGPMVSPSAAENAGPIRCGTYPRSMHRQNAGEITRTKIEKVDGISSPEPQTTFRRVHTPGKEPWYGANTDLASHNHSLFAMSNPMMQSCSVRMILSHCVLPDKSRDYNGLYIHHVIASGITSTKPWWIFLQRYIVLHCVHGPKHQVSSKSLHRGSSTYHPPMRPEATCHALPLCPQ